ncbi:uncharacterized protein LOC133136747 [Conger conger]|uniref:uncharacterized protein LOC133136747 n=1 Tax=Conger conger TaxID=82655 RepID=UPI002A5A3C2D|nr:uncharacterized protein LOC133136747 [Conger conger]
MELPLLIVALFLSTAPVSRAEEDLFVLNGDSVRLDVKRHEELQFSSISWRFNITRMIVNYIREPQLIDRYENSIISEFDKTSFSLLLKNVTQNYSGIYTAMITDGGGQEKAVATYRLTVQVSRAEEDLFVLNGDSVRLDVKRHEELQFSSISWRFNITRMIVNYIREPQLIDRYENSIISEFDKTSFSLLLKNVTQNYSGIYTAMITDGGGQEKAVATYRLTVQVSRAEEDLFVLNGDSVRLDVKRHEELQFSSISWRFNITRMIVNYIREPQLIDRYENSIISEFDKTSFSLLLKNVTQNYSGIYTAMITDGGGQEKAVATYRLTVQGQQCSLSVVRIGDNLESQEEKSTDERFAALFKTVD